MKKEELPQLHARLNELADYYGAKAPSTAAIKIWFDCLEGVTWPDVATVLTDWPKHKRAFPVGDEVRKAAAALLSDRLEAEGKRNNALAPTLDAVIARAEPTPNAIAFKRMYEVVFKRKTYDSPRQWCEAVLTSTKADASLKAFAERSLALMGTPREALK